ncbi:MAG: type II secretion system F family protein [Bryobacteraceae bacterium]|nr:type II secretion system F family protein [Bryobacteraceae bacterium]MDW8378896.1 type II secretion system F family protein [Bryobacterales bacterium]
MTTYFYKAVAADGKARTGTLTASSEKLVVRELRRQGLTPVYVGLQKTSSGFSFKLPFGGARRRDLLFFTQEMATLLNSGVPLDRALSIANELTERPRFRSVISDVLRLIKAGKSFADALATYPEHFSELYVNMVRAGEASGSLGVIFLRLADFERTRDDLRGYIVSSLIYPALLALVGLGSIFVLLNFVVPRFAAVFEESRMQMPLPTKLMLETSRALQNYGWLALLAASAGLVFLYSYTRTPQGRMWWDAFRLQLPLLGPALRKAETARFARAMATLVANSVPLVQSLSIAAATLNNRKIAASLEAVAQGVKRGEGLAAPLRRTGEFPPLAGHLLSVGEETGKLDEMFHRMADVYENDTRVAIRRFTALFEPLVILVMGLMVGALILSMLLAITSMNDVAV